MKRLPLALLAIIVAAACQEIPSAPQSSSELAIQAARLSNPPPPPIDTGASGAFIPNASVAGIGAAATSGGAVGSSGFFNVPVVYFFNKNETSGYLHFRNTAGNNSNGGAVTVKNGVLSGKGTLTLQLSDGVLKIDLSSVQQPPSFLGCSSEEVSVANVGGVCFHLFFTSATFTPTSGSPIQGSVNLDPSFEED